MKTTILRSFRSDGDAFALPFRPLSLSPCLSPSLFPRGLSVPSERTIDPHFFSSNHQKTKNEQKTLKIQ